MAQRLDEVYVNLHIPLFASLTNAQIDHWLENIPERWKAGTFKDINNNKIMYVRARGKFHCYFAGEFSELLETPEGRKTLENWRKTDPFLHSTSYGKTKNTTQESALAAMEVAYNNDKKERVRFLEDSPLHWPSHEFRFPKSGKQGKKRKRGPGSDDENEPKRNKKTPDLAPK
jgi:hypothetical protein